jgi:hypothetical protein
VPVCHRVSFCFGLDGPTLGASAPRRIRRRAHLGSAGSSICSPRWSSHAMTGISARVDATGIERT